VPGFVGGAFGVDIFFVLSGFLITALLVGEYQQHGRIALAALYRRRVLRLLPALVLVLLVAVGVSIAFDASDLRALTQNQAVFSAVSISNWAVISTPQLAETMLAHTWSLGIEDQFYILWAPAAALLLSLSARHGRRHLVWAITLAAAFVSAAWTASLTISGIGFDRIYFGSDTRAQALLLGCTLGALYAQGSLPSTGRARFYYSVIGITGGLILVWLSVTLNDDYNALRVVLARGALPAAALFAAAVVAYVVVTPASPLASILSFRPLVWVGTISYGLYLWHYCIVWLLVRSGVASTWPIALGLMFVLTVATAASSYYLVERPFLRLKYSTRSARDPSPQDAKATEQKEVSQAPNTVAVPVSDRGTGSVSAG
jgi:peptidoglycan/LPS O-acetylase OafA/YrhL